VLIEAEPARLVQRELRAVPIGVLVMAVEQHAELVDAVDQLLLLEHMLHRLRLAGGAEHLGSVPLPIEPKPIITMGPEIAPCTGQFASVIQGNSFLPGTVRR